MSVTAKQLNRLKESTLTDYVRDRLRKKRIDPAWDWQHDEEPEDFLIRAYKELGSDFHARLNKVIVSLLKEVEVTKRSGEYISRLLDLVEFSKSKRFEPILQKWWEERDKFKEIVGYHTRPDLLVQLIRAITLFPDLEVQKDLVPYLGDAKYAPAAYRGIIDLSEDPVSHLIEFVKTLRVAHEEVWIKVALELLVQGRSSDKIFNEWGIIRSGLDPDDADATVVDQLLTKIPDYQPSIAKKQDAVTPIKCHPVLHEKRPFWDQTRRNRPSEQPRVCG